MNFKTILLVALVMALIYLDPQLGTIVPNLTAGIECGHYSGHDLRCVIDGARSNIEPGKVSYPFNVMDNVKNGIVQPVISLDDANALRFFSVNKQCTYTDSSNYYYGDGVGSGVDYSNSVLKAKYMMYWAQQNKDGSPIYSINYIGSTCSPPTYKYYIVNLNNVLINNYNGSLITITTDYGKFYGTCDFYKQKCLVDFSNAPKDADLVFRDVKVTLGKDLPVPSSQVVTKTIQVATPGTIDQPSTPNPVNSDDRNIFEKILDWIRGLFLR